MKYKTGDILRLRLEVIRRNESRKFFRSAKFVLIYDFERSMVKALGKDSWAGVRVIVCKATEETFEGWLDKYYIKLNRLEKLVIKFPKEED